MGHTPVSIALKHLQTNTPSVRKYNDAVPQSLENVVLQATAKDPFHRYNDVNEMEQALVRALDPEYINESKFVPPVEEGEETKAIPIITDDEVKQQKSNKKWWWIGGISVLLLAILLAVFVIPQMLQPKEVEIPDVTEWEYEEAVEELEQLGLHTERELTSSEDIEEDLVVRTDPRAGRNVIEGSTVTLFVSSGKEKFSFDDYVGRDFDQVRRLLINQGYEEVIAYEKNSDKPEGEIISQVQPSPNEEVVPSETTVIFEVSIGPELVSLIDLKGLTEEEVADYLSRNELKINKKEEHSESVPEGLVMSQDPKPNTELTKGTTVDVTFSKGPEEKPPLSHSVRFTVPYVLGNDADRSENGDEKDESNNNKNKEIVEQRVQIYISDMEHSLSNVYEEDYITEDKEYTITLIIEPNKVAEYRVVSNGEVIIHKEVPYEEGE